MNSILFASSSDYSTTKNQSNQQQTNNKPSTTFSKLIDIFSKLMPSSNPSPSRYHGAVSTSAPTTRKDDINGVNPGNARHRNRTVKTNPLPVSSSSSSFSSSLPMFPPIKSSVSESKSVDRSHLKGGYIAGGRRLQRPQSVLLNPSTRHHALSQTRHTSSGVDLKSTHSQLQHNMYEDRLRSGAKKKSHSRSESTNNRGMKSDDDDDNDEGETDMRSESESEESQDTEQTIQGRNQSHRRNIKFHPAKLSKISSMDDYGHVTSSHSDSDKSNSISSHNPKYSSPNRKESASKNKSTTVQPMSLTTTTTGKSSSTTTTTAKALCCDKCDGKHETDSCPYYKKDRESHPDAQKGKKHLGGLSKLPGALLKTARVVRQPGDGSCLFHSISHGLGDGSTANSLRQEICRFITNNPNFKISDTPLADWVKWDSGVTCRDYASRMSRGAWGGGIEMALAAHIKSINLHVYEYTSGGLLSSSGYKRISAFDVPSHPERKHTVRVLYCGGVHYGKYKYTIIIILYLTYLCTFTYIFIFYRCSGSQSVRLE